jgi:hypothetical protein
METKKVFLILCILGTSFCSFSQQDLAKTLIQAPTSLPGSSDYVLSNKLRSAGNYKGNIRGPGDPLYFGVNGNPFFINTFLKSDVFSNNGKIYSDVPLKYDACNDMVLIINKNDTLTLDKTKIKSFILMDNSSDKKYYFELTVVGTEKTGKPEVHFLEVAYRGKTSFLIRHLKELVLANFDPTFSTGSNYDEYSINNFYYLKNQKSETIKIKLNKKSILEALKDRKTEIKLFVSNNKLSYDTEQHAIRIFEFYDSIK